MESVASPFKFLESYSLRDAHLFFGREIETKILLADILTTRLVVLFAKTGTGKTSLINAGVRPVLHARGYRTFLIRVSEDPVSAARLTLEEALGQPLPASKSLPEQLKELANQQPIVLFFDQFEEFFLYVAREDPNRARAFVTDLAEIADSDESGSDVHMVFSMREEFLAEMEIFRDEIPTIFGADSNLRLRWFTRTQAAAAINRPLGASPFNASAEPALVERIVDELSAVGLSLPGTNTETPIEPAQLQMVCDTVWRARRGSTLTLEHYLELGRRRRHESVAEQILDQRLVEELEQYESEEDLDLLWRLLPELHTARGTKWVRELAELARTIGTDAQRLRTLLSRLHSSGLVDVVARKDAEFVELVHDYLAEPRRVESLRRAIRAISPLRLLRRALRALRENAPLPAPDDLAKVTERVDEIPLSPLEGEALLRWALREGSDASRVLPAIERSGARVWQIFEEQLEQTQGDETMYALETLGRLEQPQAAELLHRALHGPQAMAECVVDVLGGIATTRSIDLLQEGLERPDIRAQAQQALVRLVETWGERAPIGNRAAEILRESLGTDEVSPEVEERLLSLGASRHAAVAARVLLLLAKVEHVASVRALKRRLEDRALAADARAALRQLRQSTHPDVAAAAAAALGEPPVPGPIHDETSAKPPQRLQPPPSSQQVSTSDLDAVVELVAGRLLRGKVVPVLGAGVNLSDRPPGATWMRGAFLPSGRELAAALTADYPMSESRDLALAAQYVAALKGEGVLSEELHDIFDADYPPTRLHRFLAQMSRRTREANRECMLFITTNYDDSLERAFLKEGETYELLTYIAQGRDRGCFRHYRPDGTVTVIRRPAEYSELGLDRSPVIAKVHGAVDRRGHLDSFVITEDHHIDYLTRADVARLLPVRLTAKLRTSHLLFLGYDLRDWAQRGTLDRLWAEQEGRKFRSWAIMSDPSPIEGAAWDERGVDMINMRLEEYVTLLEGALAASGEL